MQYVMYSMRRVSRLSSIPPLHLACRQLSMSSCHLVRKDENFTFDWSKVASEWSASTSH